MAKSTDFPVDVIVNGKPSPEFERWLQNLSASLLLNANTDKAKEDVEKFVNGLSNALIKVSLDPSSALDVQSDLSALLSSYSVPVKVQADISDFLSSVGTLPALKLSVPSIDVSGIEKDLSDFYTKLVTIAASAGASLSSADVSILSDLITVISKYRGAVDNASVVTLSDTVKALSDLSSKVPDTSKLTQIATDINTFVASLTSLSIPSGPITISLGVGGVLEAKLMDIDSTVKSYLDTLKGSGGGGGSSLGKHSWKDIDTGALGVYIDSQIEAGQEAVEKTKETAERLQNLQDMLDKESDSSSLYNQELEQVRDALKKEKQKHNELEKKLAATVKAQEDYLEKIEKEAQKEIQLAEAVALTHGRTLTQTERDAINNKKLADTATERQTLEDNKKTAQTNYDTHDLVVKSVEAQADAVLKAGKPIQNAIYDELAKFFSGLESATGKVSELTGGLIDVTGAIRAFSKGLEMYKNMYNAIAKMPANIRAVGADMQNAGQLLRNFALANPNSAVAGVATQVGSGLMRAGATMVGSAGMLTGLAVGGVAIGAAGAGAYIAYNKWHERQERFKRLYETAQADQQQYLADREIRAIKNRGEQVRAAIEADSAVGSKRTEQEVELNSAKYTENDLELQWRRESYEIELNKLRLAKENEKAWISINQNITEIEDSFKREQEVRKKSTTLDYKGWWGTTDEAIDEYGEKHTNLSEAADRDYFWSSSTEAALKRWTAAIQRSHSLYDAAIQDNIDTIKAENKARQDTMDFWKEDMRPEYAQNAAEARKAYNTSQHEYAQAQINAEVANNLQNGVLDPRAFTTSGTGAERAVHLTIPGFEGVTYTAKEAADGLFTSVMKTSAQLDEFGQEMTGLQGAGGLLGMVARDVYPDTNIINAEEVTDEQLRAGLIAKLEREYADKLREMNMTAEQLLQIMEQRRQADINAMNVAIADARINRQIREQDERSLKWRKEYQDSVRQRFMSAAERSAAMDSTGAGIEEERLAMERRNNQQKNLSNPNLTQQQRQDMEDLYRFENSLKDALQQKSVTYADELQFKQRDGAIEIYRVQLEGEKAVADAARARLLDNLKVANEHAAAVLKARHAMEENTRKTYLENTIDIYGKSIFDRQKAIAMSNLQEGNTYANAEREANYNKEKRNIEQRYTEAEAAIQARQNNEEAKRKSDLEIQQFKIKHDMEVQLIQAGHKLRMALIYEEYMLRKEEEEKLVAKEKAEKNVWGRNAEKTMSEYDQAEFANRAENQGKSKEEVREALGKRDMDRYANAVKTLEDEVKIKLGDQYDSLLKEQESKIAEQNKTFSADRVHAQALADLMSGNNSVYKGGALYNETLTTQSRQRDGIQVYTQKELNEEDEQRAQGADPSTLKNYQTNRDYILKDDYADNIYDAIQSINKSGSVYDEGKKAYSSAEKDWNMEQIRLLALIAQNTVPDDKKKEVKDQWDAFEKSMKGKDIDKAAGYDTAKDYKQMAADAKAAAQKDYDDAKKQLNDKITELREQEIQAAKNHEEETAMQLFNTRELLETELADLERNFENDRSNNAKKNLDEEYKLAYQFDRKRRADELQGRLTGIDTQSRSTSISNQTQVMKAMMTASTGMDKYRAIATYQNEERFNFASNYLQRRHEQELERARNSGIGDNTEQMSRIKQRQQEETDRLSQQKDINDTVVQAMKDVGTTRSLVTEGTGNKSSLTDTWERIQASAFAHVKDPAADAVIKADRAAQANHAALMSFLIQTAPQLILSNQRNQLEQMVANQMLQGAGQQNYAVLSGAPAGVRW
jgi:hypothetical protein